MDLPGVNGLFICALINIGWIYYLAKPYILHALYKKNPAKYRKDKFLMLYHTNILYLQNDVHIILITGDNELFSS